MTIKTDAEAVTAAIEHLDRVAPEGWRDRINLDTLDLYGHATCVLGQVFATEAEEAGYRRYEEGDAAEGMVAVDGGYTYGLRLLREDNPSWPEEYDDGVYWSNTQYLDEWKRQLS